MTVALRVFLGANDMMAYLTASSTGLWKDSAERKKSASYTRHEEAAAFMAYAYAKYTGRLGCCLATSVAR
jgi:thiamine pyrophosphate-dependent acetolactate synthase large subunit-like protein